MAGKAFPAFPAHAHPQFYVSGKRPVQLHNKGHFFGNKVTLPCPVTTVLKCWRIFRAPTWKLRRLQVLWLFWGWIQIPRGSSLFREDSLFVTSLTSWPLTASTWNTRYLHVDVKIWHGNQILVPMITVRVACYFDNCNKKCRLGIYWIWN